MLRNDVTSEGLPNPPHHRFAAGTLAAPRLRARLEHHARHRRYQPTQARDLANSRRPEAVFILSLSGTDETTGQVLKARGEYPASAVRWNATFRDILEEDGRDAAIDYSKFHDVEPLAGAPSRSRISP